MFCLVQEQQIVLLSRDLPSWVRGSGKDGKIDQAYAFLPQNLNRMSLCHPSVMDMFENVDVHRLCFLVGTSLSSSVQHFCTFEVFDIWFSIYIYLHSNTTTNHQHNNKPSAQQQTISTTTNHQHNNKQSAQQQTISTTTNHQHNNKPSAQQQTISTTTNHQHNNKQSAQQQTISTTTNNQHNNKPSAQQQTISTTTNNQHNNKPSAQQQTISKTTNHQQWIYLIYFVLDIFNKRNTIYLW